MSGAFAGKVAIVTGGGSGIGEAPCLELGRRAARVVVADINGEDAQRVAAAITAAKMMTAERAARAILEGVTRNKALIVFPASIRWGRRISLVFPHLFDGYLRRQMRQWRSYRPAARRTSP